MLKCCTRVTRARVARTVAKCVMSILVTRNDILLFTLLLLCLYARDSLSVNGCSESPNRENYGVARPVTRSGGGCPGDFFVNRGNIFENHVMINVLYNPVYTLLYCFYREAFIIFRATWITVQHTLQQSQHMITKYCTRGMCACVLYTLLQNVSYRQV